MLKRFVILAVAVLGFSGFVSAAEAPVLKAGTITGTVLNAEGSVITGATVEFKNSASEVVKTTTTDKAGAYRFENVAAGTYTAFIANANMGTVVFSEEGTLGQLNVVVGSTTGEGAALEGMTTITWVILGSSVVVTAVVVGVAADKISDSPVSP